MYAVWEEDKNSGHLHLQVDYSLTYQRVYCHDCVIKEIQQSSSLSLSLGVVVCIAVVTDMRRLIPVPLIISLRAKRQLREITH